MKHASKFALVFFIYAISFYEKVDYDLLIEDNYFNKSVSIQRAILFEKEKGSYERTYDNTFAFGERKDLANPRVFIRKDNLFKLETDYFHGKNDSILKVILYQWQNFNTDFEDTLYTEYKTKGNSRKFNDQYKTVIKLLTHQLGKPREIDVIKDRIHSMSFNYGHKWANSNFEVTLFMHDDRMSFREIRLFVVNKNGL